MLTSRVGLRLYSPVVELRLMEDPPYGKCGLCAERLQTDEEYLYDNGLLVCGGCLDIEYPYDEDWLHLAHPPYNDYYVRNDRTGEIYALLHQTTPDGDEDELIAISLLGPLHCKEITAHNLETGFEGLKDKHAMVDAALYLPSKFTRLYPPYPGDTGTG